MRMISRDIVRIHVRYSIETGRWISDTIFETERLCPGFHIRNLYWYRKPIFLYRIFCNGGTGANNYSFYCKKWNFMVRFLQDVKKSYIQTVSEALVVVGDQLVTFNYINNYEIFRLETSPTIFSAIVTAFIRLQWRYSYVFHYRWYSFASVLLNNCSPIRTHLSGTFCSPLSNEKFHCAQFFSTLALFMC